VAIHQEIRHALRALRRSRGFTIAAVLSLALGIGTSTAIFSLVNAVWFSDLPFREVEHVVTIEQVDVRPGCEGSCKRGTTSAELGEWARARGVEAVGGLRSIGAVLTTPNGPAMAEGAVVSPRVFAILGLHASAGRGLVEADDAIASPDVVVLSQSLADTYFATDSSVIGRTLLIDGRAYRVVGIMTREAALGRPLFDADSLTAQFFLPLGALAARASQAGSSEIVIARLHDGVGIAELRSQIRPFLATEDRSANDAKPRAIWNLRISFLRARLAREYASSYWILLGAVTFLVLITFSNVAGLFLARCSARRGEIAMRVALGADRVQALRPLMTEATVVAVTGGALGTLFAFWAIRFERLLPPRGIPYWTHVGIDLRVLGFALGLTLLACLAVGLGPAWFATGARRSLNLRDVTGGLANGRGVTSARQLLIGVEIAMALLLLTGAGLLARTFVDAAGRDIGALKHSVLRGAFAGRPVPDTTAASARSFAAQLLERLRTIPDVAAVSLSGPAQQRASEGITREGDQTMIAAGVAPSSAWSVTPDEFSASGVPLLAGRVFTAGDSPSAMPVAILDSSTAQHLYPEGPAVGRRLKFGAPSSSAEWLTIVGVVGSTRGGLTRADRYSPSLFRPFDQALPARFTFQVRTRHDPELAKPAVRAAVREILPNVPLATLHTIEARLESELAPLRVNALIAGVFATIALLTALLGVFGVTAYVVAQRTQEIGLRIALGATPARVMWVVMRPVLTTTGLGVAAGLAASLAVTRVLRAVLFNTSPTDPRVLGAATLLLSLVAVLAAAAAAGRVWRVDPISVLRAQ
jgi:predicted permease